MNSKVNFISIGVVGLINLPINSPSITVHSIIVACALIIFFAFIIPISS